MIKTIIERMREGAEEETNKHKSVREIKTNGKPDRRRENSPMT